MRWHKLFWRLLKLFNANGYFRNNIQNLKQTGVFFLKHPDHFLDHKGYTEAVTFVDYDEKRKEITVKRTNHKEAEKAYIRGVKKSQIFINAK